MPSILGHAVANKESDKAMRATDPRGYINADIPVLIDLDILQFQTEPEVIMRGPNGKLVEVEDIRAFLTYVANDSTSYPLPMILRCYLEDMLGMLESARLSVKTADATRAYEGRQMAEIRRILTEDDAAGGEPCRPVHGPPVGRLGDPGLPAGSGVPTMLPTGSGVDVQGMQTTIDNLIKALEGCKNKEEFEALQKQIAELRAYIEANCNRDLLQQLLVRINDLEGRTPQPWPEPPQPEQPNTDEFKRFIRQAYEEVFDRTRGMHQMRGIPQQFNHIPVYVQQ